jgi:hypothetical protein
MCSWFDTKSVVPGDFGLYGVADVHSNEARMTVQ